MIGKRFDSRIYNIHGAGSFGDRVTRHVRRKIYRKFMAWTQIGPDDTLLDIGVTADKAHLASNFIEHWYPFKHRITALGVDDAAWLERNYPGMRFVRGDGRAMPFADDSFSFTFSSAVLEHVGSRAQQQSLVAEAIRVARRGAFLVTPNRWFPLELHSGMPLIHWLPPHSFRAALGRLGLDELAHEENLNLLDAGILKRMARHLGYAGARIGSVSLLGWPSNVIVYIAKHSPPGTAIARP